MTCRTIAKTVQQSEVELGGQMVNSWGKGMYRFHRKNLLPEFREVKSKGVEGFKRGCKVGKTWLRL